MQHRPEPSLTVCRDIPASGMSRPPLAVAIGNFDGLHLGHRAVLSAMLAASRDDLRSAALTFEPHPRMYFNPQQPSIRLMPFAEKARAMQAMGVSRLLALRFNRRIMEMAPERFVSDILVEGFNVRHLVTGEDFVFGHQRRGNVALLAELATVYGYTYQSVPAVMVSGAPCSSTRLREALGKGDLELARTLTGRNYGLEGRVVKGEGRGRQIGFPTANIHLQPDKFLPADGVYAIHCEVEGSVFQGVANLGVRPTFEGKRRSFEAHLFNCDANLYDARARVWLVAYLRGETRFDGIEALKQQIGQDIQEAKYRLEHS